MEFFAYTTGRHSRYCIRIVLGFGSPRGLPEELLAIVEAFVVNDLQTQVDFLSELRAPKRKPVRTPAESYRPGRQPLAARLGAERTLIIQDSTTPVQLGPAGGVQLAAAPRTSPA